MTRCSYLILLAASCSYLSLHVAEVKSIQMWAQVTISFWICNPQFQLLTCNGVQSLSRETHSVQECQYRNKQKCVLVLIKKIHNNWNLCIFFAFYMNLFALFKNACIFVKVHVCLPKMHAFWKNAYKMHITSIQNTYQMFYTSCHKYRKNSSFWWK